MTELEKQREITNKIINSKLKKSEKNLLKIYKNSLDTIRLDLLKLEGKFEWTQTEMFKFNRLQKLQNQILIEIKKLNEEVYNEIKELNNDLFVTEYNRDVFAITKELGTFLEFDKINVEEVKAIENMYKPKIKLNDLTKKQANGIYEKLKEVIGSDLALGESLIETAKKIKDVMNNKYWEALRIARTEGIRATAQAHLKATEEAENLGLKIKKEWVATLDLRTREHHRIMDGKYADDKGIFHLPYPPGASGPAPTMTGVASEDINCRCTYNEKIEGFSKDVENRMDNETKQYIKNMSYEDWYNEKYKEEL